MSLRVPRIVSLSRDKFHEAISCFQKAVQLKPGYAEVNVVEDCQRYLEEKIASGEFVIPGGVSYTFAGSYENQVRAQKTLIIVVPLALFIIFLILYFQFKSTTTSLLVFSGIIVAWSGGFLMIWLYAQPWFLDFSIFGVESSNARACRYRYCFVRVVFMMRNRDLFICLILLGINLVFG